jgi:magnesium-transporting ATPase (P-type)
LTAEKPVPGWKKFLAQFIDVLVILLLIAAVLAVLWVVERESPLPYEATAILAVVLLNAVMGYIQESCAESAVAALRKMSAAEAAVLRDGERRSVIILIEEGDTIPARCAADSFDGLANRGGCAHGREPAGVERHRSGRRRRGARRPHEHGL